MLICFAEIVEQIQNIDTGACKIFLILPFLFCCLWLKPDISRFSGFLLLKTMINCAIYSDCTSCESWFGICAIPFKNYLPNFFLYTYCWRIRCRRLLVTLCYRVHHVQRPGTQFWTMAQTTAISITPSQVIV